MREQSSIFSTRLPAGAVCALALLFFLCISRAGEPIQVSNDKSKSAPTDPNQQVDADMFKTWNKSKRPIGSPLNSLTPFIGPGQVDPKDERRMKSIREEKKNWMLLESGELQKRDQEEGDKFGGRTVTIGNAEETKDGNYLFYNVTSQKSDRPSRQQNAPVEEDQPKKDTRSRETEQQGAHTANELNLKNLIDPTQINTTKMNDNEAALFQFLKGSSTPPPDRDQQARRDNFRDFINGPQGNPGAAPSGPSDPINFRTDLTQERINPIAPVRGALDVSAPPPKAADSFFTKAPLGATFTPGRAGGLPEMISTTPRQPMPGPSLPSPLMVNDPAQPARVNLMGNGLFNREGPRRGGL